MIVDRLENCSLYGSLTPRLATAFEYLSSLGISLPAEDVVEIDGRNIFARHMTYKTADDFGRFYEAHRDYIDIQLVLSGEERVRVSNVADLTVSSQPDINGNYHLELAPGDEITLRKDHFAVLFCHEVHILKLMNHSPALVEKVVVKVRI